MSSSSWLILWRKSSWRIWNLNLDLNISFVEELRFSRPWMICWGHKNLSRLASVLRNLYIQFYCLGPRNNTIIFFHAKYFHDQIQLFLRRIILRFYTHPLWLKTDHYYYISCKQNRKIENRKVAFLLLLIKWHPNDLFLDCQIKKGR